ncbi:MAG: cardiolipin synthase [Lentisphaerae bacterium]|nr:cardiolipin synthase [Lentisphaerota bacterium]
MFNFSHLLPRMLAENLPAALLHVATFLLVSYHCLMQKKEASASLLWIFSAWVFPGVGPLLYISFGIDRVPKKSGRKTRANRQFLAARRALETPDLPLAHWRSVHDSLRASPTSPAAGEIDSSVSALLRESPLLAGNSIDPLETGDEAFPSMLDAIQNARDHIHIQSFIINDDPVGRKFLDALRDRARAGVRVRLLYDRFGSTHASLRGMFRRYEGEPNLTLAGWTQANLLKRQFQINLRNHRKLLIVDGAAAFMGGINLQLDHTTHGGIPPIRDYHFAIRGPVVQELQYVFLRDWNFITDEEPKNLLNRRHFPEIEPRGSLLVRAIPSGPTEDERDFLPQVFFLCMTLARRRISLVTPYFIPTPDILRALQSAALRGVDVRILTPGRNNHVYAGLAARSRYEPLLQAGVRIFERAPPFIHAKAMVIDNEVSVIGTANLDVRSLLLNYESDLLVYSAEFARAMTGVMDKDFQAGREIILSEWQRRPPRQRFLENFCNLLTPIV